MSEDIRQTPTADRPVVLVAPDTLHDLIFRAVRSALAEAASVAPDLELTVPQLCEQFDVGRHRALKLIEHGVLKAKVRTMPGGRDGYVVRYADALRSLALRR